MNKLNKKLESYLLSEIDLAFKNEKVSYVLNLISLAYEKKLFNKDFFELFFIKAFHAGMKDNSNIVPEYIVCFGLTPIKAGKLIQKYTKYELNKKLKSSTDLFLIVNKIVETSILSGIIFDKEFLLDEIIKMNIDGALHKALTDKNNENNTTWLNKKLGTILVEKKSVKVNRGKI